MTRVCLTFDFDAVSIWVSTFKQTTALPVSRGEYGARVGVPRILDLLAGKGIRATFFVPAHTATSFPAVTRRILEAGHEIASHGLCHESPVALTAGEEAQVLETSAKKLQTLLGSDFWPRGYRSPAWDLSDQSIAILEDHGYTYDSSLMADDFQPYRPRRGDKVGPDAFVQGEESSLVELPVAWELDDYPYFHFASKPFNPGLRLTEDVRRLWQDEFDYCHRYVRDGVFTLTNHPEIIGRGPRILMLKQLIDHMQAQPGVTFSTASEAVAAWQATARPATT
jgi:peptidoglycan-N-acetylglucosamine deacetylase